MILNINFEDMNTNSAPRRTTNYAMLLKTITLIFLFINKLSFGLFQQYIIIIFIHFNKFFPVTT